MDQGHGRRRDEMNRNSIILIAVLVINMIAVSIFGIYFYRQHKADEEAKKAKAAAEALAHPVAASKEVVPSDDSFTRKVVKFESLVTNLAGDDGRREARISLEALCEGDQILKELDALKPKIRDIIIISVGSATADDLSSAEGKEKFKAKLRDDINAQLTSGKLKEIFITELQLN